MNLIKHLTIIFIVVIFQFNCANNRNNPLKAQSVTATAPSCYECHGENTLSANKMQWAQAGWAESVHANGLRAPIYGSYYDTTLIPPANVWYVAGYEWHGSDAFYSNGQGCQVCHTKEGFLKRINGDYGTVDWSSGSAYTLAINADSITNPSPLNCFTCHAPHANQNFDLTVLPASTVVTQTGAIYNDTSSATTVKTKGSQCASCHQVRLSGFPAANDMILANVQGGSLTSFASYWGPHHGPQTDVLLGKGGAEYTGLTYGKSQHSTEPEANCVNCHMADDFANLDPVLRYSLSPGVGGHSMNVSGIVHGAPAANKAGCTFSNCHDAVSTQTVAGKVVGAFGAMTAGGYLPKGKAYVDKTGGSGFTSAQHYAKMNGLLKIMADPAASCNGLLQDALTAVSAGKTIKWQKMADNTFADTTKFLGPACVHAGFSASIPADAAATATSPVTRFAKALYNFKLVLEDKSMGIHNSTYEYQLLYDSCTDLKTLPGIVFSAAYDCTLAGTFATRP